LEKMPDFSVGNLLWGRRKRIVAIITGTIEPLVDMITPLAEFVD